ncbi:MAG TPA: 50S ribosomal protein L21 [Bacteroidetes bacterium]|nr:50S ribosomal protein L21 [Bacteroidota bacterium]
MHPYAIAEISGRQFRIEKGARVQVPRLPGEEGEAVTLDKLLLVHDGDKVTVGAPYIEGAGAEAKILAHGRGRKIFIVKKKRRKGYRRQANARARHTVLEIVKLSA